MFRAPAAQLHILGQTVSGKSLTTAGATSADQQLGAGYEQQSVSSSM